MNTQGLSVALHVLVREWFKGQIGDLAEDELPPVEEIEADMAQMRDDTLKRITPALEGTNCLQGDTPNDPANTAAMVRLQKEFVGLEKTTPILTKLALSKIGTDGYTSGWPLCAIRLVAETWLPQAKQMAGK